MTPTPEQPHPLHLMLPQLGTDEEFRILRELLAASAFDSDGICRRLGISSITEFNAKCEGRDRGTTLEGPLDVLVRLALDGEFVPEQAIRTFLPAGALEVLESLQVLARDASRPRELYSTICLYPADYSLILAGDRQGTPDGSPYWMPADVVYPGLTENTRNFVASLPQTSCDALLDLGTGSGVAALAAARYARHAWGTDIASRSVRFAEFNRRLNGIENVTMAEGDMYQAVAGLTFDRIVTHPPYVPAPKTSLIFRDGGDDGEQILRRAIEGLPEYLRPGGCFYTLVLGADLPDEPFEDRIRKWLGARQEEFDVVMVSHSLRPPAEFVANSVKSGKIAMKDLKYWADCWARRGVQFLFYGSVLIHRHAAPAQAMTSRVQRGDGFRPEHQEWLLHWESEFSGPESAGVLLDSHPSIAPGAELHVLHRVREGRFSPEAFGIEVKGPFVSDIRCADWMVKIIGECDGIRSWREHYERAVAEGLISPETSPTEFAELLKALAGHGILQIPERPMPSV